MLPATAWEDHFNRRRPSPDKLLDKEKAKRLQPGDHIMVMFRSAGNSFEFKIVDGAHGYQLEDVYNRQRMPADDVFSKLGEVAPFHVAWRIR